MKQKTRNYLKFFIKLSLTAAALYVVFTKVDFREFWKTASTANVFYLLAALLAYNLSKIFSAFRIMHFYKAVGVRLEFFQNIRLYYVGMLYNLSLPGAIGGDGYKIYLLKHFFPESQTKSLVGATLLDRLSGLAALFFLACLALLFTPLQSEAPVIDDILVVLLVLVIPVYYGVARFLFPAHRKKFGATTAWSFGVQGVQAVCAWLILRALGIDHATINYLALFFVSSVAAVVPITIGGAGARELVFVYGYNFLHVDRAAAIAFTLIFFVITVVSSLAGLFFAYKIDRSDLQSAG